MRVVAKRTELKCKLCSHPKRQEIDQLLLKRSNSEKDDDGKRINADYVIAYLSSIEVVNPTLDNIKGHWKNHCEIITEELAVQQEQKRREIVERSADDPVDVDSVLDRIISLGQSDLEERFELTGKSGVTVDQILKAASVKSQRRTDEATRQLLGATGAAISAAFAGKALPAAEPEVIEGEAVEEALLVVD